MPNEAIHLIPSPCHASCLSPRAATHESRHGEGEVIADIRRLDLESINQKTPT
jgi:hypothetical protein